MSLTPGAVGTKLVPDMPKEAADYVDEGQNKSDVKVISSRASATARCRTIFVSLRLGDATAVSIAEIMNMRRRSFDTDS